MYRGGGPEAANADFRQSGFGEHGGKGAMRASGAGVGWILQERVKRTILSSRLRKARREMGLTALELASRSGLAPQRVVDLELSCCDVPAEDIRAVAGALDVVVDHLL